MECSRTPSWSLVHVFAESAGRPDSDSVADSGRGPKARDFRAGEKVDGGGSCDNEWAYI